MEPVYAPMCKRCKGECKQRADMGTRVIKCPMFEPKDLTSRGDKVVEDTSETTPSPYKN